MRSVKFDVPGQGSQPRPAVTLFMLGGPVLCDLVKFLGLAETGMQTHIRQPAWAQNQELFPSLVAELWAPL